MQTLLLVTDSIMCGAILLAALDYLRANHFTARPWQSLAFFVLAVAAFGLLLERLAGVVPSPWAAMLHLGLITYAAVHRVEIFDRQWAWAGCERRNVNGR